MSLPNRSFIVLLTNTLLGLVFIQIITVHQLTQVGMPDTGYLGAKHKYEDYIQI